MSELNEREYYERRERVQRRIAEDAQNPAIARIHNELANFYAGRVLEARRVVRLDYR